MSAVLSDWHLLLRLRPSLQVRLWAPTRPIAKTARFILRSQNLFKLTSSTTVRIVQVQTLPDLTTEEIPASLLHPSHPMPRFVFFFLSLCDVLLYEVG